MTKQVYVLDACYTKTFVINTLLEVKYLLLYKKDVYFCRFLTQVLVSMSIPDMEFLSGICS